MTSFWAAMTRSLRVFPLAVIATLAATIAIANQGPGSIWLGQWYDTSLYVNTVSFVFYGSANCVAGVFAAQHFMRYQSSYVKRGRRPGASLLPPVLASLGWILVGLLLTECVAYGRTALVNPGAVFSVSLLVLPLGVLVGLAALAFGAGLLVKSPALLLIAGLFPYALVILSGQSRREWVEALIPIIDQQWAPSLEPHASAILRLTVLWLASGVLLVLFGALRRRLIEGGWFAFATALCCVLVLGLGLSIARAGSAQYAQARTVREICYDGGGFCLWRGQEFQVAQWNDAYRRFKTASAPFDATTLEFAQPGLPERAGRKVVDISDAAPSSETLLSGMLDIQADAWSMTCKRELRTDAFERIRRTLIETLSIQGGMSESRGDALGRKLAACDW